MPVDWARLTDDALGLRALAYAPLRARLEDTGSATEVGVGVAVVVGEAGLGDGDVVRGHPLAIARARAHRKTRQLGRRACR